MAPSDHPLARLILDEIGVVYDTDQLVRLFGTSLGPDSAPAAMRRNALAVLWSGECQTARS